ncbi:MAG: hypothetical protein WBL91_00120, partial [Pseudolabrys sp.]
VRSHRRLTEENCTHNMNHPCGAKCRDLAKVLQLRKRGKPCFARFFGTGKRNLAVVGMALLLSCCTNERETKTLLGIPDTVEQTPDTDADRNIFACRQYGFVPGTQQWDEV